jgi:hypothetical protein
MKRIEFIKIFQNHWTLLPMYLMARVFRIRSGEGAWLYNRPGFLLPEQRYQRRNHTEYTHSSHYYVVQK